METAPSKPASQFPRFGNSENFLFVRRERFRANLGAVTFAEREASAMAEHRECRHCNTEQLIDLVLNSAHHRLRERCERSKIVAVLEEKHGAYDAHGGCALATGVACREARRH